MAKVELDIDVGAWREQYTWLLEELGRYDTPPDTLEGLLNLMEGIQDALEEQGVSASLEHNDLYDYHDYRRYVKEHEKNYAGNYDLTAIALAMEDKLGGASPDTMDDFEYYELLGNYDYRSIDVYEGKLDDGINGINIYVSCPELEYALTYSATDDGIRAAAQAYLRLCAGEDALYGFWDRCITGLQAQDMFIQEKDSPFSKCIGSSQFQSGFWEAGYDFGIDREHCGDIGVRFLNAVKAKSCEALGPAAMSLAERCNGAKEAGQELSNHDVLEERYHDTDAR